MQNIHEILKAFNLEIPGDKKAEFDKIVLENYKTVAEVGKLTDKLTKAEGELKKSNETLDSITGELNTLKNKNATAEDWKTKFEQLQEDNAKKEKLAKEEREKAEREENIKNRFNAVCVDKDGNPLEWSHEAIKDHYLKKFGEAIFDSANVGKSDVDIFYTQTKDDATAFKTIQPQVNLPGANPIGGSSEDTLAAAKAVMGIK